MDIPDDHLENVCRPGKGKSTCVFLMFGAGFECAKKTGFEKLLRDRRAQGETNAKGDNCSGPPDFKTVEPLNN